MGVKGVHFSVFLVVFCFTLVAASGSKEDADDHLLVNLINSNKDLAELLWLNCKTELVRANKAVEDASKPEKQKHNMGNMHPLVKQALIDCLRDKDLLSLVDGEEKGTANWYAKCLEYIFSWNGAPKHRILKEAPKPPPAPVTKGTPAAPAGKDAAKDDKKKTKKKSKIGTVILIIIIVCSIVPLLCICGCCYLLCRKKK